MALINFDDKVDLTTKNVPLINKIVADDINQLKNGVNTNKNSISALTSGLIYPIPQPTYTPSTTPAPTENGIYTVTELNATYVNFGNTVVPNTTGIEYKIQVSGIGVLPVYTLLSTDLNINSYLVNSFAYNNTYATASISSLNITTSEILPKGIIKTITLKAVSDGVCKFAFLRQLTNTPTYKPIKYFECSVVTGKNIIKVNEFIDEDFYLCLLSGSVSIYTASTNVGDPLDLHYFSGDFTDSSTWTKTFGRGTNIESDINVNPLDFPTKTIGKSITYCGDSITDFCDSPSSNGVQYVGFDAHIDRYLKFNIKNIYGFSGIKLAQTSGFSNSKAMSMPTSDYYVIR